MNSEIPIDPLSSAAGHAELRLPASGSPRFRRVLERLTRFFLEPQRAYNRGVIDAIQLLRDDHVKLEDRLASRHDAAEHLTAGLRSDLTQVQLALADGQTDAALTRGQVVELAKAVQRLESRMADLDAAVGDGRSNPPASPLED